MLFGGVNATQFRFFMKWEIIFFERFLFHLWKIWKIMPLKSTIFLSGRKYIYHGTHLVVVIFLCLLWLWILHSFKVKKKNSGKKFITIIYRVMIWSREKKGQKFFFVSLHYAFGWKYICHYSKHRVNLKKKTLLGAGLVFFSVHFWNIFRQTHGNFFWTNFFYIFVDQSYWRNFSCYGL